MDSVREILENLKSIRNEWDKELEKAFEEEFGFKPQNVTFGRAWTEIYPDDELKQLVGEIFGVEKDRISVIVFEVICDTSFCEPRDYDWTPVPFGNSFCKRKGRFVYAVKVELEFLTDSTDIEPAVEDLFRL